MNLDEYKQALASHDWHFEYSDSHQVWERGTAERIALREAQRQLDPLGNIWNEHAPSDFRIVAK